MANDAGTVFYVSEAQLERYLSDVDQGHQFASIGTKEAMKLAFILNKNSPYKPMFDQVQTKKLERKVFFGKCLRV